MSISASIKFELENAKADIIALINEFERNEWSLVNFKDEISYTPLGDEGDFNWIRVDKSHYKNVLEAFQAKQEAEELIAFTLNYIGDSSKIGIDFLVYPQLKSVSCGLNINRRCLKNRKNTDFSWYLDRMLPLFDHFGMHITSLECTEIY